MLVSTRWSWNQSSMEFHLAHFRSLPTPHLCDCLVYGGAVWPKYALWLTASRYFRVTRVASVLGSSTPRRCLWAWLFALAS